MQKLTKAVGHVPRFHILEGTCLITCVAKHYRKLSLVVIQRCHRATEYPRTKNEVGPLPYTPYKN